MAIKETTALAILALVEIIVLFPFIKTAVLGILYGSAFSILGWWLMVKDVKSFAEKGSLFKFGFLLRYFLYAVGMGTAIFYGKLFFAGTALGILNLKLSLYIFGRWLGENTTNQI